MLTAPALCKNLGLSHEKHGHYVRNLKSHWRQMVTFGQGSFGSFSWNGWVNLPKATGPGLRVAAVKAGWVQTRALNKWLLWRDPLGRLQWFETGRVNIHMRGPASTGRLAQLLAQAFHRTGLIADIDAFEKFRKSARSKGNRVLNDNVLPRDKPRMVWIDLGDPKKTGVREGYWMLDSGEREFYTPKWHLEYEKANQDLKNSLEDLTKQRKDLKNSLEDLTKQTKPKPVRDKEIGVV
jgi:hypothetical protein